MAEFVYDIFFGMFVATQSTYLTMNRTQEQSGERDVVKDLKTTPCILILLLFSRSTPVFHFWEGWSEERKAGWRE